MESAIWIKRTQWLLRFPMHHQGHVKISIVHLAIYMSINGLCLPLSYLNDHLHDGCDRLSPDHYVRDYVHDLFKDNVNYVCNEAMAHILPWNKNRPTILANNPAPPVTNTMTGFLISSGETNLSIESIRIVKHKASRNTPLINAPNISALCHP